MRIIVRLHTILRRETPEGVIDRLELDLPEGASVAEVVSRIEIKTRPRTMLLVVNGKIVQDAHVLKDGDELRLVPGVSGGSHQAPPFVPQGPAARRPSRPGGLLPFQRVMGLAARTGCETAAASHQVASSRSPVSSSETGNWRLSTGNPPGRNHAHDEAFRR
jgi:molybdopterin converting factor small subunit